MNVVSAIITVASSAVPVDPSTLVYDAVSIEEDNPDIAIEVTGRTPLNRLTSPTDTVPLMIPAVVGDFAMIVWTLGGWELLVFTERPQLTPCGP